MNSSTTIINLLMWKILHLYNKQDKERQFLWVSIYVQYQHVNVYVNSELYENWKFL